MHVGFNGTQQLLSSFKCCIDLQRTRLDKYTSTQVKLSVELWHDCREDCLEAEDYRVATSHILTIHLYADEGVHCHLPVFFDYPFPSAISVVVHASLVGISVADAKPLSKVRNSCN